ICIALDLQPVDPAVDFPALTRCLFDSYETPPQPFFHIFFPLHSNNNKTQESREKAIAEAATRLKLWQEHDKTMVLNTGTGRIAGGALLNIHESPFANPVYSELTWFPEGLARRFAEKALKNHVRPRSHAAPKPRLCKECTISSYSYITKPSIPINDELDLASMDWGMKIGFDFFLDSSPCGRPVDETNGSRYIKEDVIIPMIDQTDDKGKKMEEKSGLFTFWLMWRPLNGVMKRVRLRSLLEKYIKTKITVRRDM
ncbi:hypothetical protein PG993_003802, partial [Apiospora rasikravindrae]